MSAKNSTVKICVCSEYPPPYGGIGLQAKLLADWLDKEPFCSVSRVSTTLPNNSIVNLINRFKGVRGFARILILIYRCIFNFYNSDIIHILTGSYLNFFVYTFPMVLIGNLYKKKVLIHYHGGAADSFFNEYGYWIGKVLERVDCIIVPSGFLEDVFKKNGFSSDVIPNIVPLDSFKFEKRDLYKPKILITRHLDPVYNVSCAVHAFSIVLKKYSTALLTIAGSGSERHKLEKLAKELGCHSQIVFLGAVDSSRISELYTENDILLNTSNIDNLPLSILEGFACGLLVVSTKAGGIPYVIEDKKNGLLVELNDDKGVAQAIDWALVNQDHVQAMTMAAYSSISMYSWANIGAMYKELYNRYA